MLLLVMHPEFDQRLQRRPLGLGRLRDQPGHGRVHVGPIGQDVLQRRARQQAPLGSGMPLAHGLIVGVEQIAEHRVERLVALQVGLQQEGLEEPGHVRQVPLGGTDIGHGLDLLVFGAEWRRQRQAFGAHRLKAGQPRLAILCPAVRGHERRGFSSHSPPLCPCGLSTDARTQTRLSPTGSRMTNETRTLFAYFAM